MPARAEGQTARVCARGRGTAPGARGRRHATRAARQARRRAAFRMDATRRREARAAAHIERAHCCSSEGSHPLAPWAVQLRRGARERVVRARARKPRQRRGRAPRAGRARTRLPGSWRCSRAACGGAGRARATTTSEVVGAPIPRGGESPRATWRLPGHAAAPRGPPRRGLYATRAPPRPRAPPAAPGAKERKRHAVRTAPLHPAPRAPPAVRTCLHGPRVPRASSSC